MSRTLSEKDIERWLRENDEDRLNELWTLADETRRANVGDNIYLRGLVEFSNCCSRQCGYCGLRSGNKHITRYRMSEDQILDIVQVISALGISTVVLQSGEDYAFDGARVAKLIRNIRERFDIAITLSLGERRQEELVLWRTLGADRYLLRFETSNRSLFNQIHPPHKTRRADRIALLHVLRELDYEVGSGIMVGIPGQTMKDLVRDLLLMRELDLDMIGIGPYLPHPSTPLGKQHETIMSQTPDQVPNTALMTCKVLALARLLCPFANIPSTTALSTLDQEHGRELGLLRGANIVMPDFTPSPYREAYEIYPGKSGSKKADGMKSILLDLENRIESIGRHIGKGRGDSPAWQRRCERNGDVTEVH